MPPIHATRRTLLATGLATGLAAGAAALATPALAQAPWPSRPIRLIIPFASGGTTDVIGRLVVDGMAQKLGQPIVVDNRPGAGATLGTGLAAEAPPDGHTMLMTVISSFSIGSTLYRGRIGWDPLRSFEHVGMLLRTPYALMANNAAPFTNPSELVAAAKARPGIGYSTSGVGSLPHLFMLRFAQAAGIELTHVPYRGGAQAVNDVIAGTVPVTLDGIAASVGFLRTGTLRGIGVTSPARLPDFPAIPTFVEHGFGDLVVEGWAGFAYPANTPRPIVERTAAVMREVMEQPAVQERYKSLSNQTGNRFLGEMTDFVRQEIETWRPLVIASGATAD